MNRIVADQTRLFDYCTISMWALQHDLEEFVVTADTVSIVDTLTL